MDAKKPACRASFIVPAYNEAKLLGPTLEAIRHAAWALGQPHEVIVVDDASSDGTAEVARDEGALVIRVNHRQISRVRNAGARVARGEYLFFVDADTLINVDVLRAAWQRLQAGDVGGGAVFRFDGPARPLGKVAEWLVATLFRRMGLASGCFVYCRNDVFAQVGGFDENLFAAEEWALSKALKALGTFQVLPTPVMTSARKLDDHSVRDLLRLCAVAARTGLRKSLRSRELLDVWYRPKRAEH